ncbi:MAG: ArsC family reductase [Porticoccaceae bacterium]|nr:ArsC family reductase [Pseudomonadales bacterium]MCP5171845.1 ArsC family reductase [Pseudomonadales bacterium]
MITLYGIKNCDTIKKARKWLDNHDINYRFHDVRADGIDNLAIQHWVDKCGWETVINKRGTTWRKLPEQVQQSTNEDNVVNLLLEYPAMIKRPVLDTGKIIEIGFKEARYQELLG